MKTKKIMSLFLSALLILTVAVPAAAESDPSVTKPGSPISAYREDEAGEDSKQADERLAEVTLKVKETLGVGDDYASFYGDYNETEYGVRWQLNWNSDKESLSVQADENGKIYSMNLYAYDPDYDYKYYYRPRFDPVFPDVTRAEAAVSARAFVDRVLDENEGVVFTEQAESPNDVDTYGFSGNLTVNGLKTDAWVNVSVRTSDLKVTYFYRDDGYYYVSGGFPTTEAAVSPEEALRLFKPTFAAKAQYAVLDGGKQAKLVYYVSQDGSYVVDAKTGELVSINEYYAYAKRDFATTAEAGFGSYAGGKAYLTETELKGIEHLEDTLTDEELDALIRAETAFGLTDEYVITAVDYNVSAPDKGGKPIPLYDAAEDAGEDGGEEAVSVAASVTYTLKIKDYAAFGISDEEWSRLTRDGYTPQVAKTFTLDAKTGQINSCYTNYYGFDWVEKEASEPVVSETAKSFLSRRFPKWFGETGLYSSYANNWNVETYSFTFCQSVNGYLYPGNSIYVGTNAHTGYVDSFSYYWDDEVTFAPAPSVIGEEAAVAKYMEAYKAELRYSRLPVEKEPSDYSYPSVYKVLLAYTLADREDGKAIDYIDAVTGEVHYYDWPDRSLTLAYDDIDGCYAKDEILKLAEYGVGFYAPSFEPSKKLTELDMILFLISANGYKYAYDKLDEATVDSIYGIAYDLDILEKGQKEPDRAIARADIARSLVSMAGYSEMAELRGIYRCGFADDEEIADGDYGYVAIAKGLGIVTGDPSGSFRPYEAVTRQEMAHMMFKYMSRG